MKSLIALTTLCLMATVNASVVAIMDTGTDISHKDFASKVWTNKKEVAGSTIDMDGSGLPGDVHGWDFTEGSAKVFNDKYNYLVTADVVKFYATYAKYELKTINQMEFTWLKAKVADKKFMAQANFVGGYAHGTHVGGVSALNNPKAEIMSLKILPTVYEESVVAAPLAGNVAAPKMTVEEYKQEVIKYGEEQVTEMVGLGGYLNFHKVDVVNQSFGIGYEAAVGFIGNGFIESVGRQPSEAELKEMVDLFFDTIDRTGPDMFKVAPKTLFVIAAGNDSSNNDAFFDFPANIQAANKIVVAASLGYTELADFSNYGVQTVDVAAPGVAIQSTSPNQTYVHMSGTSQAAPFVTNVIALMKDLNPALTAADLKSIIFGTVDVKSWLKGKVATSGVVNKARALRAAELAKTTNVAQAIAKSKVEIADVAVTKSFVGKRSLDMKLNIKPFMPSLLVKKAL